MKAVQGRFILTILIGLLLAAPVPGRAPKYQENPVAAMPTPAPAPLKNARIQYVGVTKFSDAQIRSAIADQINAINQNGLQPASADDAAFFLGVFYRRNGYSQADVRWEIAAGNTLVLKVSEGPLTVIGNVSVRGNTYASEKDMVDYILGATRERYPRLKTNLPYVEEDIKTGVDLIRGLYASEGFLKAVVDPPVTHFNKDNTVVDLVVTVHEGIQYKFGKPNFDGDLVFFHMGNPDTEMLSRLASFLEKPFTTTGVANMQRSIVYYYRTRGYYDAKVTADANPDTAVHGVVPLTFHIESGSIYRFGNVKVEGLDRLRPGFLPKRFRKLRGKFYNPEKLDELFREMMRTGLFKQLKVAPRPLPDHDIELDMKVEEAKAKELGLGFGYGTFEGVILGLSAADRDLLGTGRPLTATVEFAQRYLKGEVVLLDPWLLESDYSLRLRLYGITESFDGYSKVETGLRAEISRQITKHLQVSAFVQPRQDDITDNGIDSIDIGQPNYFINSIGASFTFDLRDSKIDPTHGFIFNGTVDYSSNLIGSSVDFFRTTYRASYYLPIGKTLLAFGARGGIIFPVEGQGEIPIDERFFNGGSRSVRSFTERDLGPKDRYNFPIGGNVFTTYNAEYTFPLVGELQGAVFFDAGSVSPDISDGFGQLRYGVGGGVRYKLPVGPLRIDYGYNPSPKQGEAQGAFQFSFGIAF